MNQPFNILAQISTDQILTILSSVIGGGLTAAGVIYWRGRADSDLANSIKALTSTAQELVDEVKELRIDMHKQDKSIAVMENRIRTLEREMNGVRHELGMRSGERPSIHPD